ncbi:Protein of unknown function [Novosphingobium mathurense]|uniref:DUF2793 domain-containing protein n=2 Tax=Sphingomonadaceae TaxID=41297 RepID=A0A1U6HEQ1_9SPHN|nr:conserved hypothetical protein [Novosphingobium sp. KN65.2]SLJ94264.1 Protein of unknown function [Novosphingobium mathurense]
MIRDAKDLVMSDPVIFESNSPRFSLPLLYSGQSGKEVFVNEAFARIDAALHCSILGENTDPPENPADGDNWLISADATGEWAGYENAIACRQSGNWIFLAPHEGMRIFDRSSGQELLFFGFWRKGSILEEPVGGSTVDVEARASINEIIAVLQALGISPSA